jgi:integrase
VGETFGVEVARFLDRKRGALRPRTFAEVKRHLTTQAGPLVRLRLAEIDRRTIAARLAEIERDSGPFARNRMRSSLATFFAWCISEGFLEPPGPVAGTDKATEGSRDRVITDPELAAIWRALGPGDYGDIVRLLILTGQRRDEIGALRWSEVDLDRGLLVLPASRTKNKRQHEVPLAPMARGILAARSRSRWRCVRSQRCGRMEYAEGHARSALGGREALATPRSSAHLRHGHGRAWRCTAHNRGGAEPRVRP